MKKNIIATILMLLCLFSSGLAQDKTPIAVDADRVLSQYGESETVQLSLPIQPGPGEVSRADIKRSEASALRVHFVVSVPAGTPSWAVVIMDKKDKKIWAYSAAADQSAEFWSDQIPGEVAKVRVFAVAEIPNLRLSIDQIIVSRKATEGRGLTVNKLKSIDQAPSNIQGWGRSVARLVFVRNGVQFLCTGFLIAADLLMTNNHCINTPTEMSSWLAEFDYDRANATPVTLRFSKMLETNPDLDFTLLRLATPTDRTPFTFDTSLSEPRNLVMIQHPAGRPKQVSIDNCKVMGKEVAGVTPVLTDFGHGCDTLKGSSGSPAIDIQSGRVLGLHHLGYLPNNEPINRAVQIQRILDFLRTNLSDGAARQALGFPAQ